MVNVYRGRRFYNSSMVDLITKGVPLIMNIEDAVIYNAERKIKREELERVMNGDKLTIENEVQPSKEWTKEVTDSSKYANNRKTESEKTFVSPVTGNKLTEEEYNSLFKPTLKDSGARREFSTGAVRDISDGKGRCDLLPLDIVGDVLHKPILELIEYFKETKDPVCLVDAIRMFSADMPTTMLEVSKHYEAGANKYSENNWKKGIPLHCYIDSGVRHYLKYLRGDTDEPHDRAFVWNMLCALWTLKHKPELDDIEKDIKEENKNE